MGGLFEGGDQKTTATTQSEVVLPDYLKQIIPNLAGRIEDVSLQPYQPFTDQRFAEFTPDQLAAFQGVRGLQGASQPLLGAASQAAMRAGQGITPESIQSFMSPYQQQVTDIGKREALRDFDIQMEGIGDLASQAGAFGGSRHGVVESEARRNLAQQLGDIQAQGSQQAYGQALGAAGTQAGLQQAGAGTLANLANVGQQVGLRDVAALQQIGGQQQALGQAGLDFDYSQFLEQQAAPFERTQFAQSNLMPLLSQVRGQTGTSTQTTQAPSSSPFSKIAGIASLAAAPFTGGASLAMGGGGGMMGGLGNLLGGMGGGSGMLGGLSGAALGANNPFTSTGDAFRMGSAGQYGPYKEGGLVKYANGGKVNRPPLKQLLDLIQEGSFGGPPIPGRKPSQEESRDFDVPPLKRILNAFQQEENPWLGGFGGGSESTITQGRKPSPTPGEIAVARDVFKNMPLEYQRQQQELDKGSPEETVATSLGSKINNLAEGEGVKFRMPTPKRPSGDGGVNLPLLALGARMLASPGESGFTALGKGVESYIGVKSSENKAAVEAKQLELDREIKRQNAETNRLNAEAAQSRIEMEESLFPLNTQYKKAQLAKLSSETKMREAMGPYGKVILEGLMQNPEFVFSDPAAQQEMIRSAIGSSTGAFGSQQQQQQAPSQEDLEFTAKKHGITVEEVKKKLGIQ